MCIECQAPDQTMRPIQAFLLAVQDPHLTVEQIQEFFLEYLWILV